MKARDIKLIGIKWVYHRGFKEFLIRPIFLKSLSKAFPAEEADRLSSRLEIVYTPKHGNRWLNIAEIELSVFSRQCLNRRIPDIETLRAEAAAWQIHRNQTANTVDWRFTTQDARIKLKKTIPANSTLKDYQFRVALL